MSVGVFNLGVNQESLAIFGYVVADLLGGGEEFTRVSLKNATGVPATKLAPPFTDTAIIFPSGAR